MVAIHQLLLCLFIILSSSTIDAQQVHYHRLMVSCPGLHLSTAKSKASNFRINVPPVSLVPRVSSGKQLKRKKSSEPVSPAQEVFDRYQKDFDDCNAVMYRLTTKRFPCSTIVEDQIQQLSSMYWQLLQWASCNSHENPEKSAAHVKTCLDNITEISASLLDDRAIDSRRLMQLQSDIQKCVTDDQVMREMRQKEEQAERQRQLLADRSVQQQPQVPSAEEVKAQREKLREAKKVALEQQRREQAGELRKKKEAHDQARKAADEARTVRYEEDRHKQQAGRRSKAEQALWQYEKAAIAHAESSPYGKAKTAEENLAEQGDPYFINKVAYTKGVIEREQDILDEDGTKVGTLQKRTRDGVSYVTGQITTHDGQTTFTMTDGRAIAVSVTNDGEIQIRNHETTTPFNPEGISSRTQLPVEGDAGPEVAEQPSTRPTRSSARKRARFMPDLSHQEPDLASKIMNDIAKDLRAGASRTAVPRSSAPFQLSITGQPLEEQLRTQLRSLHRDFHATVQTQSSIRQAHELQRQEREQQFLQRFQSPLLAGQGPVAATTSRAASSMPDAEAAGRHPEDNYFSGATPQQLAHGLEQELAQGWVHSTGLPVQGKTDDAQKVAASYRAQQHMRELGEMVRNKRKATQAAQASLRAQEHMRKLGEEHRQRMLRKKEDQRNQQTTQVNPVEEEPSLLESVIDGVHDVRVAVGQARAVAQGVATVVNVTDALIGAFLPPAQPQIDIAEEYRRVSGIDLRAHVPNSQMSFVSAAPAMPEVALPSEQDYAVYQEDDESCHEELFDPLHLKDVVIPCSKAGVEGYLEGLVTSADGIMGDSSEVPLLTQLSNTITTTADVARELAKAGNTKAAVEVTRVGHGINTLAQRMQNCLYETGKGLSKGLKHSGKKQAGRIDRFLREPIKELYTIAQGLDQLSFELLKLKVRYEQDPLGTLRTGVSKTKQLATQLMQAASGMTVEQFCRAAGEVAGKAIIEVGGAGALGKISGTAELFTAIGSVKKGLQTAADIAKGKKVEQLMQTFSRKTLKRAAALVEQQPSLFEEGCSAVDMVQKASAAITRAEEITRTLGKKITPEVLLTLEKLPAESLSKKVFEEFWLKNKMPKVNWRHVFVGENVVKKGRVTDKIKGFHYSRSYPEKVEKLVVGPNKSGITKVKVVNKVGEGISDLFPKDWDRAKIGKKVKEAYENIIKLEGDGFIGKTIDGLEIQFWPMVERESGNLIFNSIYPKFK